MKAQAIFILVDAPAVFEPECKSPERLKNVAKLSPTGCIFMLLYDIFNI
jgi:hypothetical protein